jgi:hypothetical protein
MRESLTSGSVGGPVGHPPALPGQPFGACPKRLAIADGARRGTALEILGWEKLRVHGAGGGWRQGEPSELLPSRTRAALDGRLPFRDYPLGFFAACPAALAAACVLGQGAHLLEGSLHIRSKALAVSAHPALQSDTRGGGADATEARLDLGAWLREARVLPTGRCERVLGLLQAHGCFGGAAWTALCGLIRRALQGGLQPCELLPGFDDGLVRSPLLGGHGTGERFDPLCCPGNPSGEWCASRECSTEAHSPGAASLVAWIPRPLRGARAGAIHACQLAGSRACARGAKIMPWLSGASGTRQRPPAKVSAWVTGRSLQGRSLAKRAVATWREGTIACAMWTVTGC